MICGRLRRTGLRVSAFQEAAAGASKFYAFIQTTNCCFSVRIFITFLIFRPSQKNGLTRRPVLRSRPQITHTKVTFARSDRKKGRDPTARSRPTAKDVAVDRTWRGLLLLSPLGATLDVVAPGRKANQAEAHNAHAHRSPTHDLELLRAVNPHAPVHDPVHDVAVAVV